MAHIVHIIDRLNIGGAQSLLVTLAQALRGRPHSMAVVSLHHDDTMAGAIRACGVPVTVLPGKLRDVGRIAEVCRLLQETNADLIHTHLGFAHVTGTLCGRLMGLPVVASLHSMQEHPAERFRDLVHYRLQRWVLRTLCDRIIAVGPHVAVARAGYVGRARMEVIENAVIPPPPLSAGRRAAVRHSLLGSERDDGPLFIAVGRLSAEKGFADLIDAFAIFGRSDPRAALAIVGGGELMGALRAQVAGHGLDGRVFLPGARTDVPELLAASDVFVMPSHWEGMPVAVLEAMAAGLPVVATRVGDLPNLVSDRTGLLVEPQDPAALAGALSSIAGTPDRWAPLGRAGKRLVDERYSPDVWASRLCRLYDEVLDGRWPGTGRRHWSAIRSIL
ncbi:glycosyltransferase [Azospirillum sp. TSO35-2]|uniref:glycosyltransferase n=1 Tax=Azospirillum sp. TSO35-2 TaxID=716796 RepID=UPI000D6430BB|nr:glycosyltransferase [Azospirillum sp. TSO35-2]